MAVYESDLEKVKLFIQERDDVDETSLSKAALKGHIEIVKELIKAKPNVLAKNHHGDTPYQTTLWWYQDNQKNIEGYDEVIHFLKQPKVV